MYQKYATNKKWYYLVLILLALAIYLNGATTIAQEPPGDDDPIAETSVESQPADPLAPADQLILDDLIVDGSICVGFDCVNGESFGFDTLRLKENNLRIRFQDTSNSSSFPTNDWQITVNDSTNGGANRFSIDDIDGGRTPFTLEAGAPSHSLYVDDEGLVGLGTNQPVREMHIKDSNIPTIRLEQDGSWGFSPQTWDVGGYEVKFFIRDETNDSLPFQVVPGAPTNSIFVASSGRVGLGTELPVATLHVNGDAAKPGGGSWTDSSDARLKENIHAIDGREALDLLGQLQGVTFEWANPEQHSAGTRAGLLAQDLEKVFPDWVDEYEVQGSDAELIPAGEMAKGIHFPHDFNAYLIEALKALDAENQALSDVVEEQDAAIADLEARVKELETLVEALLNQSD